MGDINRVRPGGGFAVTPPVLILYKGEVVSLDPPFLMWSKTPGSPILGLDPHRIPSGSRYGSPYFLHASKPRISKHSTPKWTFKLPDYFRTSYTQMDLQASRLLRPCTKKAYSFFFFPSYARSKRSKRKLRRGLNRLAVRGKGLSAGQTVQRENFGEAYTGSRSKGMTQALTGLALKERASARLKLARGRKGKTQVLLLLYCVAV